MTPVYGNFKFWTKPDDSQSKLKFTRQGKGNNNLQMLSDVYMAFWFSIDRWIYTDIIINPFQILSSQRFLRQVFQGEYAISNKFRKVTKPKISLNDEIQKKNTKYNNENFQKREKFTKISNIYKKIWNKKNEISLKKFEKFKVKKYRKFR